MSLKQVEEAIRFTQAYQQYTGEHPAIREVMCISELYPRLLVPLEAGDSFAGTVGGGVAYNLPVAFSVQHMNQIGYTMNPYLLRTLAQEHPEYAEEIDRIILFWKRESTFVKIRNEAPTAVRNYLFPHGIGLDGDDYLRAKNPSYPLGAGFISGSFDTRVAGLMPDYGKLMRLGLPGLRAEIAEARCKNPESEEFYRAADQAVEILIHCAKEYQKQATALGLDEVAEVLAALQIRPPQTLREGIQLLLLHSSILHVENFGRLDITLGRLLVDDLSAGRLDEESAVKLLMRFWEVFERYGSKFDSRILIGGIGRPDEAAADKFALLAMEATRRRHAIVPVLTLRLTKSQNPALLDKALTLIGEGCIYPTLYNDDAYLPGIMKSMHIPKKDALRYAPLGCGEMVLEYTSVGSPNSTFRFLKALEATLHNGCDGVTGEMIGAETGTLEEFDTYEKLEQAFFKQIRAAFELDVQLHLWNRKIAARETSYVFACLLMDDCLERGRGLHDGGVRYFGANVEGFGQTNTVNSLAAIKKLVYEEKRFTLRKLVEILDKDFEGHEEERQLLLRVEKFGNNDPEINSLKRRFDEYVNQTADEIGRAAGLQYYTVASVNPGGITIGPAVAASADGRRCGTSMALGNSPDPGTDQNGITSMLLSAANTDPANGGVVTNMNLSRETVQNHRESLKSAFLTYFQMGGLQLNVNCFSKGDLEKAMIRPEEYKNLIVRVSGYSARFIDLDDRTKKHIMERTLY